MKPILDGYPNAVGESTKLKRSAIGGNLAKRGMVQRKVHRPLACDDEPSRKNDVMRANKSIHKTLIYKDLRHFIGERAGRCSVWHRLCFISRDDLIAGFDV
jgi:hypothetical protein